MYLTHYNLKENPFQISPDPRFIWLGENHKAALKFLENSVFNTDGLILIKGDVGTGKTTLINAFLEHLDEETRVANITFPVPEKLDFLNFVANKLNIDTKFNDKMDFLIHFKRFLNNCCSENKKVILIIDEAHRLDQEFLEQIQFLSNIGRQYTKFLKIIFSGQDEFINILSEKDNQDLRQKLTTNYHIEPLKDSEVGEYILHRLKVAGNEGNIFSAGAIGKIFSFSKGYPRFINIICDHALSAGYVKGVKTIDAEIIKECADGLRMPTQRIDGNNKEQETLEKINEIEEEPAIKSSGRTFKSVLLLALAIIVFSFFYCHGKFGERIGNIKKYFGHGPSNQLKLASINIPQNGDANKKINPVAQDLQESDKTSLPITDLTSKNYDAFKQGEKDIIELPKAEKTQKPTSFEVRNLTAIDMPQIGETNKNINPVVQDSQKPQKTIIKVQQIDSNAAQLTRAVEVSDEKKQTDHRPLSLSHVEKTKLDMDQDRLQPGRYTVYLYYASEENKELMEGLTISLKNKGFGVLGIERVDYQNSDIRYFHSWDKAGALLLQKYSTEFITPYTNLKDTNIRIKDLSQEYPNARKGALELWVNL